MGKTLFEKLWEMHVVEDRGNDMYLLAMDRIYLHDLCGTFSFQMLNQRGYRVRRPEQVVVSPDHTLVSTPGRTGDDCAESRALLPRLRQGCEKFGLTLYDLGDPNQGIIHIIGPEQGYTIPGITLLCGDSHTCTHGAMGALSFGVGTSEVYYAVATGCLLVKKPRTMRVWIDGDRGADVGPMDIILGIIGREGIARGTGCAVEYCGPVVSAMTMDERFTLCNLTIEMGAEYALIAPDETTISYLKDREHAPKGEMLWKFLDHCVSLRSDDDCRWDQEIRFDVTGLSRQVTWGINPGMSTSVGGKVPQIPEDGDGKTAELYRKAYDYIGVQPGQAMEEIPIQRVFVGACSNGRLSQVEAVAGVVKGKRVAPGVTAWVVPGSEAVKKAAEERGLDQIIKDAGFLWGEPGCSLCVSSNGERVAPGEHCVSTTNRNFIGRQGRGSRTHLASPITAALSALAGKIQ